MYEEMILLVSRLAEYLRTSEQQLQCFPKYESQLEGWFKGELLYFLDREKREGRLPDRKRENVVYFDDNPMNAKKRPKCLVDVVLQFDKTDSGRVSWVELKHWRMWYQKNKPYGSINWYFKNSAKPNVEKLLKIRKDGEKFMLILLTENPGFKKWNVGVEKFNKSSPVAVCPLTNPGDYPDYFFLGLLYVPEVGRH